MHLATHNLEGINVQTRPSDTIHKKPAVVLILHKKIYCAQILLKPNELVTQGNSIYLLYGWFSSMRVARVMQAMPSNCRFLVPFMYPRVKTRSISPTPRNNVSGCRSVKCTYYKFMGNS
jgi:hypothetical protein